MAREPVAIDFIGMGLHGGLIDDERGSRGVATRLVRPVPSAPEFRHLATTQGMSQMSPEGFRNWTGTRADTTPANPIFAHQGDAAGLSRPPWMNKHAMAMRQIQEQSSGLAAEVSESRRSASPSHHTKMSTSSNRFEVFAQQLAQQARKAASMYSDPQQAVRNNTMLMRTSPIQDEAHAGPSGAETQGVGFGSPVPFYNRLKPGNAEVEKRLVPQQHQHQQAAHALARPPAPGNHPQTAQLTIFYAGMVNVYDEVPFDKAQAIMLLAGKGTLPSDANVLGVSGAGRPVGVSSARSQPPSRAGSPAPHVTETTSNGAPLPPTISNRPTPATTTELPQARKASLARFLERRNRVRRGPYTHRNTELALAPQEARVRLHGTNSPVRSPSSSSRPPTRSTSPPDSENQNLNILLNANRAANWEAGGSTSGMASKPDSPKLLTSSDVSPVASPPSKGKAAIETEHLS